MAKQESSSVAQEAKHVSSVSYRPRAHRAAEGKGFRRRWPKLVCSSQGAFSLTAGRGRAGGRRGIPALAAPWGLPHVKWQMPGPAKLPTELCDSPGLKLSMGDGRAYHNPPGGLGLNPCTQWAREEGCCPPGELKGRQPRKAGLKVLAHGLVTAWVDMPAEMHLKAAVRQLCPVWDQAQGGGRKLGRGWRQTPPQGELF